MKILLSGGGTGGPVQPVLAVGLEIKKISPAAQILFVGTRRGPEKNMTEKAGIEFKAIAAAKFRRYFSLKNIFSPFVLVVAFLQALNVVRKFRPDVMFSAGGYVAVPVAWAAKIYRARIVIHQQDAQVGLANKLMVPIADQITTAFEKTSKEFYAGSGLNSSWDPASWVGNPVRPDLFTPKTDVNKYFNLHEELPILLVLGGASGALQINAMISNILPELVLAHQVIHQTGKGKNNIHFRHKNYHAFELIEFDAYAAILAKAHLVIARAGLSTIAELSALGKSAIIIPMPHTHQEENAKILEDTHSAVVLKGADANPENLSKVINSLKFNQKRTDMLMENISKLMPQDATAKLAKIIIRDNAKS